MVFGSKKKDGKVNTKGLIAMKQDQIAEVEAEMTALTNECNDLKQQYKQYKENGETLKALEAEGQLNYKQEKVLSHLKYKRQTLVDELGGVNLHESYFVGLVGHAKQLERRIPVLEKQLEAHKREIEAEKRRSEERIERIKRDIEEAEVEMEKARKRLNVLLGE